MTEASYTAWDDKQYVWPPPDGWYEAPDGKWWPQGYGPPQAAEEPAAEAASAAADAIDNRADGLAEQGSSFTDQASSFTDQATSFTDQTSSFTDQARAAADQASAAVDQASSGTSQALSGTGFADSATSAASGMNGWASDGPDLDASAVADTGAALADEAADAAGNGMSDAGGMLGGVADNAASSLTDAATAGISNGVDGLTDIDPVAETADAGAATLAGGLDAATPSLDQPVADNSSTVVGSDTFDASTSAATQAFGTGLMPPMADRPGEVAPEAGGGNPPGFDVPGVTGPPGPVDAPVTASGGFDDLAAAAPVSSPPPFDHGAQQQAILDAKPKGSSRGLLFAILGVVALLIIGAALFFAFGRDGDADTDTAAGETVATGPGSVSEPHPRVTGVVVFYPDDGVEQRWIVEVLEPVRDVSEEFENDGTQMLAATRIRVTNDSGAEGASLDDLRFNLVDGSDALVVRTDNSCPPGVDDFGYNASVAVGDSVEGTVCWAIPAGDLAGLKLGIESSKVQGRVHIQLQ